MQADKIFSALEEGALVLTASNRLARHLKNGYDRYKQAGGHTVWTSAGILPFESWLQSLFRDLQARQDASPTLLDNSQELLVWEQVLDETHDEFPMLNISATARSVQQAWKIACSWRFGFDTYRAPVSLDQRQFAEWARRYRDQCKAQNFIDNAALADYLGDRQKLATMSLPQRVILAGFYELIPQQQVFLDVLRDSSVNVDIAEINRPYVMNLSRISPPDDEAELQMAARWARLTLEVHPNWRLAIVVPDLQERKTELEYRFSHSFFPGYRPDQVHATTRPWNTSLGMSLALMPVAETAQLLLELAIRPLTSNELTRLMLSSYLAFGEQEKDARAAYDASADTRRRLTTSLEELRAHTRSAIAGLNKALRKMAAVELHDKHPLSIWAKRFGKLLDAAGWPGERTLGSEEYQQVEAVRNTIGGLAALDGVAAEMDVERALAVLRQELSQAIFQAQSADAPVQVLGLLEVTGLSFDAVWICSMDNQKWPVSGSPNPYLPLAWQRDIGAPHASPARELEFAQHTIEQLKTIADHVIFSHVAMRDENTLSPAHALADLPLLENQPWLAQKRNPEVASLQALSDDYGPAVAEGEHVKGGSGLLTAQAACPFRAFVAHRLLTDGLESPQLQVDPRDRGNLIHRLLEAFWDEVREQKILLSMSDEELDRRLEALAEQIMEKYNTLPGLGRFEQRRLLKITRQWLGLEKSRRSFTVEETEQERDLVFGGINMHMYIDRIDSILNDDGSRSRMIIDYKSGSGQKPDSWMEERPGEPQLPIYAITDEQDIAGISYAILTKREFCFRGYADSDDLLPGVGLPQVPGVDGKSRKEKISWSEAIESWQTNIGALATEIRDGLATVTPKKGACQWCDLRSVCRIDDQVYSEDGDDIKDEDA